jgi:hypothetical protein
MADDDDDEKTNERIRKMLDEGRSRDGRCDCGPLDP